MAGLRNGAHFDAVNRRGPFDVPHEPDPPDGVSTLGDLTPRQRQVVALMATGTGDEAIAASLGVSVRTVRSDIAALLDVLGVKTRFAAGVRLQLWSGQED